MPTLDRVSTVAVASATATRTVWQPGAAHIRNAAVAVRRKRANAHSSVSS
jgi:hypothetical protein